MPTATPETEPLSTWSLARAVAVEIFGAEAIQALCKNLFTRPLAVYLGALGNAKDVHLPYALVEPSSEAHPNGSVDHAVRVTLAIDAGSSGNLAAARPLEDGSGVLVTGRGADLQSLIDALRVHFEDALPGSVQTGFDVDFDTYFDYPAQGAAVTITFHDELAF